MTDIPTKLATATDELTEQIALLERDLCALRLGVSESILIGTEGSRVPLWFRKEGKTWRFVLVNGNNTIPLVNASRETRLLAVDHFPELITKLMESSRSRVAGVEKKAAVVRELRGSLKTKAAPPEFVPEDEARELTADYVHNLRVRYEGLLTLVRGENERLHKCLGAAEVEAMDQYQMYCDLFEVAESVFCGSQGDVNLVNPDALEKLMEVVRARAHEAPGEPSPEDMDHDHRGTKS